MPRAFCIAASGVQIVAILSSDLLVKLASLQPWTLVELSIMQMSFLSIYTLTFGCRTSLAPPLQPRGSSWWEVRAPK